MPNTRRSKPSPNSSDRPSENERLPHHRSMARRPGRHRRHLQQHHRQPPCHRRPQPGHRRKPPKLARCPRRQPPTLRPEKPRRRTPCLGRLQRLLPARSLPHHRRNQHLRPPRHARSRRRENTRPLHAGKSPVLRHQKHHRRYLRPQPRQHPPVPHLRFPRMGAAAASLRPRNHTGQHRPFGQKSQLRGCTRCALISTPVP